MSCLQSFSCRSKPFRADAYLLSVYLYFWIWLIWPQDCIYLCSVTNNLLCFPPPAFPSAQMGPAVSQQPCVGTYAIIQPSVVVVGGCPACRWGQSTRPSPPWTLTSPPRQLSVKIRQASMTRLTFSAARQLPVPSADFILQTCDRSLWGQRSHSCQVWG